MWFQTLKKVPIFIFLICCFSGNLGFLQSRVLTADLALEQSRKIGAPKAIKLLLNARHEYPDDSRITYRIAWLFHKMNRRDQALKYYKKTHALQKCHASAWNNRANLALDAGKPDIATKHYQKAIDCDPELASAWYNLANRLRKTGKNKSAIKAYTTTIKLKPEHYKAHHNIALVYINEIKKLPGNKRINSIPFRLANKHLKRAIQIKPKDAYSWYNKARMFALVSNRKQAIHDYKMAYKILPSGTAFRGRILLLIQSLKAQSN